MTSRSWLFVPGSSPERFDKARGSGADAVIVDLEDAVDPASKDAARDAAAAWLGGGGAAWVRINDTTTPWGNGDLDALRGLSGIAGVMVPKAEDPADIERIAHTLARPVIALIETARGVARVHEIASASGVHALAFGSLDYALDISASHEDTALLYARSALVVASRAYGLMAPIDGVTTALRDTDLVGADARRAKALGFGGKLCIHPAQIDAVTRAFAPSAEELTWAQGVLVAAAEGAGAATAGDGAMVDRPVIERARVIVEAARSFAATGSA